MKQLQTFLAVASSGSFSEAGLRLHSVQSNITSRIRKLEQDLGGPLFDRGKAGARLTPLGQQLVPHARDILSRIAAARTALRDASGVAAPLHLGALETTAGSRLPPVLRSLTEAVPQAEIRLSTGPSLTLTRRVWDRELDAAFVVGAVDAARFRAIPAFEETLVVVHPAGLADGGVLLAFAEGCSYRQAALDWLRETGRADIPVRQFGSVDAILGCVGAGMGFAVMPESAVRTYNAPETLRLVPLDPERRRSVTSLVWRLDASQTGTLMALQRILQQSQPVPNLD